MLQIQADVSAGSCNHCLPLMTTQVEHVFIVFLCHLRHQKILHWVGAAMPAHAHPLLLYFVYHCLKPVNVVVFKVV